MNGRKLQSRLRRHGGAEPRAGKADQVDTTDVSQPACGCAASGLPKLKDLARDPHEALAMSLLRFVFAGYCSGRMDAWDKGFDAAEEVLGHEAGALFFSRVLTLGRALKTERIGNFNFMQGHCSRISEDELELLAAIQAARSADPRRVEQTLFVLSRRCKADRLASALRGLAIILGVADAEHGTMSEGGEPTPDQRCLH